MRSHPLDTLLDLAREARNKAGQLLAGERGSQQQLASQLDMLRRYRDEYSQRLQHTMDQGIDLATLQDYQNFLSSLDTAIVNARENLDLQKGTVSRCQERWQEEQQRLSSYDTLASRRQMQARQQAQRTEMRQHDEISNNLYLRERQKASTDNDSQELL